MREAREKHCTTCYIRLVHHLSLDGHRAHRHLSEPSVDVLWCLLLLLAGVVCGGRLGVEAGSRAVNVQVAAAVHGQL